MRTTKSGSLSRRSANAYARMQSGQWRPGRHLSGVLISGRPGARFRTVCGPARTPTTTSMALACGITSSNILEEAVIFDRAMTDGSRGVLGAIVSACATSRRSVVPWISEVRAQGSMIAAVLAAYTANTHGILFDRPTSWHGRNLYGKRLASPDGAPCGRQFSLRPFPRVATHTRFRTYPARLGRRRLARDPVQDAVGARVWKQNF